MRDIYSNAHTVRVWLGEAENDSDLVMRHLLWSSQVHYDRWNSAPEEFHGLRRFRAVLKFCERDYWTRIWIVQEIMLARRIDILCGDYYCGWDRLVLLLNRIKAHRDSRHVLDATRMAVLESQAVVIMKAKAEWVGSHSLARLLKLYRSQQSTDIRDKVYALHGLAHDTEAMAVDYFIDPKTLLTKVMQHISSLPVSETPTRRSWAELAQFGEMLNEMLQTNLSERDLAHLVSTVTPAGHYDTLQFQFEDSSNIQLAKAVMFPTSKEVFEPFAYGTPGALTRRVPINNNHFHSSRIDGHYCYTNPPIWRYDQSSDVIADLVFSDGWLNACPCEPRGQRVRSIHQPPRGECTMATSKMFGSQSGESIQTYSPNDRGIAALVTARRSPVVVRRSSQSPWRPTSPRPISSLPSTNNQTSIQSALSSIPANVPVELECLFWYLECQHKTCDQDAWKTHCRAHFRGAEPPKTIICQICDRSRAHTFDDGWDAWERKMQHYLDVHARDGSRMISDSSVIGAIPFLWRMRNTMGEKEFEQKFGRYWGKNWPVLEE
jgi:hypothetical protein